MQSITAADRSIISKSETQLAHFIRVRQQETSAHLLAPTTRRLAAEPPPAGAPGSTDLTSILNNAVKVPSTTSIATVPTTPDTTMYQMLGQVQTLDSYISLLTAFCVYNEHPAPYDISNKDQASAFARAMAKWRNYVITGGTVKALAGYLPVGSVIAQSYSKEVMSVDLHLEFLSELFGGFNFPKAVLGELDSILTKVVAQLGNVQLSFESESATLDHFLTYFYFATVAGTGGEGQPPAMYVAKIRTFFMHIDQASWKVAVGKSSAQKFNFHMNYYDMDTTMNSALVSTDMATINATIQTLTGQTAQQVNKLMNMQAVHADPQKS
jgi:hypothetical protein